MDPITLATVTSAVVNLALEAAKDLAPTAFKDTWEQVKQWLGFSTEPAHEELAPKVAACLKDSESLLKGSESLAIKILEAVRKLPANSSTRLLGSVQVTNGQVQVNFTIHGGQNNTFHFAPTKPVRG